MPGAPNLDLTSLSFGMREVLIAAIALIVLYMLWQLIQMLRLALGKRPRKQDLQAGMMGKDFSWDVDRDFQQLAKQHEQSAASLRTELGAVKPSMRQRKAGLSAYAEASSGGIPTLEEPPLPEPKRSASRQAGFGSLHKDAYVQGVEQKLNIVREEMSEIRKDLTHLHDRMVTPTPQAQISENTSPIYSDAMRLASQGVDAVTIADRCGIPLGEATLVVALSGQKRQ